MKITYLSQYNPPSRSGQRVMCRDLEVGESAIDYGTLFEMKEDGLYVEGRHRHSMEEILKCRKNHAGCNREVKIL